MVLPERPFLYPRPRALASVVMSLVALAALYTVLDMTLAGGTVGVSSYGFNFAAVAFAIAVAAAAVNLKGMLARDELILAPEELDYHTSNRTLTDLVTRRGKSAATLTGAPGWAFLQRTRVLGVEPPGTQKLGPVWIRVDAWDETSGKRAITVDDVIRLPLGHSLRVREREWLCDVFSWWLKGRTREDASSSSGAIRRP
jgi:hypothetical protein